MALLQQNGALDLQQVTQIIGQLNSQQKLWLSGYLAAAAQNSTEANPASTPVQLVHPKEKLSILFGSQTGNSETLAEALYQDCQSQGIAAELLSLADVTAKDLKKKSHVALIISTHGEGEAPDDAEIFYEQLFSKRAPELKHLHYSLLALGDSSYELFCHTGKEIDERLSSLGAQSISPRIDCDVDFNEDASRWHQDLLPKVKDTLSSNITALPTASTLNQSPNLVSSYNRNKPYVAEVLQTQKITADDSDKYVYHIELAIDENAINYQAGDSVGIIAHNDEHLVDGIIELLVATEAEQVQVKDKNISLKEALTKQLEITQISKPFIQFAATHLKDEGLQAIGSDHEKFTRFVADKQLIDLIQIHPELAQLPAQELVDQLRGLTPRLYSIASSGTAFPDEIHLTVGLDHSANHNGLASGLLCDRLEEGDEVSIYIDQNKHFKLPTNNSTDIIMIGPGTGIAPFRAFIQERQEQDATGKNWLFFGNPHFDSDFLYQTEWQRFKKQGLLNRIDLAWSRDQSEKIYVQDRLSENSADIWQWIENGAAIYVCGDANRMAKDVENTLIQIISEHGGLDTAAATNKLKELKRNKQYLKDVY
nr:assimilatory sulfite reductase (NADPH) flavoprotein subunit [Marinicella rhabdoformis]